MSARPNATKLALKACVFILVVLGTAAAGILGVPSNRPDYMVTGLRLKHAAIASAPSGKIVLVGGSSGAFGFDSELIQRALGRPVVNMALNAPVGLEYMLNEIRPYVRAGDVVVLAPEYHLFYPDLMDGWHPPTKYYPWMVLDALPEAVAYFTPGKLAEAGTVMPGQVTRLLGERLEQVVRGGNWAGKPVYRFNAQGDFIGHLGRPQDVIEEYTLFDAGYRPPDAAIIRAVNEFSAFARAAGATVVLVHPPLLDAYFDRNADGIARFDQDLRRSTDVRILTTPGELRYPKAYFYDTVYHLNAAGRAARAEALAILLRGVA